MMSSELLSAVLLLAAVPAAIAEPDVPPVAPSAQQERLATPAVQPAPGTQPQGGPDSFQPSEKIRAGSAISFPVDI